MNPRYQQCPECRGAKIVGDTTTVVGEHGEYEVPRWRPCPTCGGAGIVEVDEKKESER